MNLRPFACLSALALFALAACGDDAAGAGGAGGSDAVASSSGTPAATSTPTSSSSSSDGGGPGDGGAGGRGVGEGGVSCVGELPEAYDETNFAEGAAGVLALRAQLGALNAAMLAAETDIAVTPTAGELTALYEAATPSLADGHTSYYDGVVREVFTAFEAAAGNEWTPAVEPVAPGGIFGAYIFDETGRDLRQWVEKGSFNAHFYPLANALADGEVDAAALDALLAAYGSHPDFPGDSAADTAENPDRLVAQYAERRSPKNTEDASQPLDPDAPGPYFTIKRDFIIAQAAIAAGCDDERDAAIERILASWERVLAASVVYYLNDSVLKLTADGATPADLASGLHGIGEGASFIHGFKESTATRRTITDAEVDAFLALVADPHRFVVDPAGEAPDLFDAIDQLAAIYDFSDAELEAFETNH